MVLSMTGFGSSKDTYKDRLYSVEIKALNGKTSDMRLKVPAFFKSKEIALRKHILKTLNRGKIDFSISVSSSENDLNYSINSALIETYFKQLSEISKKHNLENQDFLQTIIRIPSVVQPNEEELSIEEWNFILSLCDKAIVELNVFRKEEGESIQIDLQERADEILRLLISIEEHEEKRKHDLQKRLRKLMTDHLSAEKLDENRLEQEAVYYLEKLDIHEEKIRLEQHCKYFLDVMNGNSTQVGKKLGFIAQEMGREINTLGSKAQYSPIQQIVVNMKVELDKIREQLANIV